MEKYTLEKVTQEEVACCGQILESGRQFQRAQGFQQWTDNYPNTQDVAEDCRLGRGYDYIIAPKYTKRPNMASAGSMVIRQEAYAQ